MREKTKKNINRGEEDERDNREIPGVLTVTDEC